ncbi:MAG: ERF family protein [Prevotella sp.]|nr:ERF family protein [Prevotella sp.]
MKELITIQSELKAPKTQVNRFGGYKYRKAEDILEAVKPLLAKQKCTLIISDDIVMIGNRIYVKATATIKNDKGECETTTGWAREEETKKGMDGSQITGASSSYARKYALNGLFAIDDNADSDTTNTGQQDSTHHLAAQQTAQTQQQQPQATAQQAQPQYHPDNLAEALEMVKRCVNRDNIKWVMGTYMPLNSNPQFMQALSAKRKELGL